MNERYKKVAVVSGICVRNDAISASVHDDIKSFDIDHGFITKLYTYRCEYDDVDSTIVKDVNGIIFDKFFIECDLIVYHFGIYYDLFNAICVGNGRAPQVVRYHNLTPSRLLPLSERTVAARSSAQLHNLAMSDAVWPVSDINCAEVLAGEFVPAARVELIPLCVGDGARRRSLRDKSFDTLRLLYVGRFVKSKGLIDLVRAAGKLRDDGLAFELRLVGEQRFSSAEFVQSVKTLIKDLDLGTEIKVVGAVSESALEAEYDDAHILVVPSYHEGFCKPVIEAMRSGCIPVTYDAYNLPYVARRLSRTAPTGQIDVLAERIKEVAQALLPARRGIPFGLIPTDRGRLSVEHYETQADSVLAEYGFPSVSNQLQAAASNLIATCGRRSALPMVDKGV